MGGQAVSRPPPDWRHGAGNDVGLLKIVGRHVVTTGGKALFQSFENSFITMEFELSSEVDGRCSSTSLMELLLLSYPQKQNPPSVRFRFWRWVLLPFELWN